MELLSSACYFIGYEPIVDPSNTLMTLQVHIFSNFPDKFCAYLLLASDPAPCVHSSYIAMIFMAVYSVHNYDEL